MAISKSRFPPSQEGLRVFTFISVPIHIWAWIAILRVVPSWILSMSAGELIGVVAYPLAFALLEGLLIFIGLWILAILLPYGIYRARFVSQSTIIVLPVVIWAVVMQIWGDTLRLWNIGVLKEILFLAVIVIILSYLVARSTKVQKALNSFVDRLLVMGVFYSLIGLLCLFIVLFNNIF